MRCRFRWASLNLYQDAYAKLMTALRPLSRTAVYGAENLISLTIDEHRELGREMKAAAKRLRVLCDLVVDVYGPANRAAFSFLKAMEAIELLQQDLATQAMRDLPGYPSNDLY